MLVNTVFIDILRDSLSYAEGVSSVDNLVLVEVRDNCDSVCGKKQFRTNMRR